MRKRRILLTLAIMAAMIFSLSSCGKQDAQANDPQTPASAIEATDSTSNSVSEDANLAEPSSSRDLADTELLLYFEMAYENGRDGVEREIGEQIVVELDLLDILCTMDGKELPGNYESLYRDWRPTDSVSNPEQSLFNEVNEVVYAIETVNIRSSYTTESDKLGTLSKGSSITRIGTGTGIAEGWDQVQFSTSNTIGFIRSTYLTTTPPQSHVTTPSTPKPSTPKPSTGGSSSTGGGSSAGGTGSSGGSGGSVPIVNGVAPNNGPNGFVDLSGGYTIDENLPDGFEIQ